MNDYPDYAKKERNDVFCECCDTKMYEEKPGDCLSFSCPKCNQYHWFDMDGRHSFKINTLFPENPLTYVNSVRLKYAANFLKMNTIRLQARYKLGKITAETFENKLGVLDNQVKSYLAESTPKWWQFVRKWF